MEAVGRGGRLLVTAGGLFVVLCIISIMGEIRVGDIQSRTQFLREV